MPDVLITLEARDITLQAALRLVIRIASKEVPGLTFARC